MGITLLAVGTAWFWILMAAAAIVVTICLENEDYGGTWSTVTCIVTLVLLYFFGSKGEIKDIFSYIENNPLATIGSFFGYIAAGVAWSIAKWYFFVLRFRDKWLKDNRGRSGYYDESFESYAPKASSYKARITSWMFYWPFSALWTSINEPIRRVFVNLFQSLEDTFNRMSKNVFMNDEVRQLEAKRLADREESKPDKRNRLNS